MSGRSGSTRPRSLWAHARRQGRGMQLLDGRLLLSASDLINYLECVHLTHLDREVASGRLALEAVRSDSADLVARKGDEHEAAHLEALRNEGREVVEVPGSSATLADLTRGGEETLAA